MLALLGFLYFSFQITYIFGMKLSGPELCALMQCINPVCTLLIGICVGVEKLSMRKSGTVGLGVAGTALISGASIAAGNSGLAYGMICFLVEGCAAGMYIILTRKLLNTFTATTTVTMAFIISLAFWVIAAIAEEISGMTGGWPTTTEELVIVFLSSFLCGAVTYSLNARASQYLAPSNVIMYNGVQPTVAAVLTYFQGSLEFVWWREGIGAVLIYASLLMAARGVSDTDEAEDESDKDNDSLPDSEYDHLLGDIEEQSEEPIGELKWPAADESNALLFSYQTQQIPTTPNFSRDTSPGSGGLLSPLRSPVLGYGSVAKRGPRCTSEYSGSELSSASENTADSEYRAGSDSEYRAGSE